MKSEPDVFPITALKRKPAFWDGVRNYQARNFMTSEMQVGDLVLFYHSNAEPSGVAGVARVVKPAAPDPTQFDKKSEYFDAKATRATPRWFGVTLEFVEAFPRVIALDELRSETALKDMALLRKGQRLSIQPVTASEFKHVLAMAHA